MLFYFIAYEAIKNKKQIFIISGLLIFISIVLFVVGVVQYFFTGVDLFRNRPLLDGRDGITATFQHSNNFGAFMLFPLFAAFGLFIGNLFYLKEKINIKATAASLLGLSILYAYLALL